MEPYVRPTPETFSVYKRGSHNYTVEPNGYREPLKGAKGISNRAAVTVIDLLKKASDKNPDAPALCVEDKLQDGSHKWITWTYKQYRDDVFKAARSFIHLGVQRFGAVSIIGFNRPEWLIAHLGAIAAGAFSAGIYTTNTSEAAKYIVNHSQSTVIITEDEKQLEKFISAEIPKVKALVQYRGKPSENIKAKSKIPVYSWSEFLELGAYVDKKILDERIADQKPGHCCSLIYTSGTTGNPKAVMLSHDNVTWTAGMLKPIIPNWGDDHEHIVSYLPLSHIAAQLEDVYFPLYSTANYPQPCTLWFARPDALKGSLLGTLLHVRPTLFFGVPRVWEKFMEKMRAAGKAGGFLTKIIGDWAKSIGSANFEAMQIGGSHEIPFLFPFFDKLVYSKVKKKLGLDRAKGCLTGAAPISLDVLKYFGSLDIVIHNLYGMSECAGPFSSTRPNWYKPGSCGVPFPGMEIRIDHDPQRDKPHEGEICYRGRNIMMGYLGELDKTKAAIDEDGFLHSGDVGRVDGNGLLWITGRIKELIITAGGENIAPVPIEEQVIKNLPALSNVMLVGDKRKFNSLLVTLRTEIDEATNRPNDILSGAAIEVSEKSSTVTAAKQDPVWQAYIQEGIDKYNLTAVSNAQKIQKFAILDVDFSVVGGELTDSLKLKRNVVAQKYAQLIDSMYH